MSQHYYTYVNEEGTEYEIFCGWDRPLQSYFLDISILSESPTQEDEDVYESMIDPQAPRGNACPKAWEYFAAKLSQFGIVYPQLMNLAVITDGQLNAGNVATQW